MTGNPHVVRRQAVPNPNAVPGQPGRMAAVGQEVALTANGNRPGPGTALKVPPVILQIPDVLMTPPVPVPLVTLKKETSAALMGVAAGAT